MKGGWLLAASVLTAFNLKAELITIPAAADTGLHQASPGSNLGATAHVPAGKTGTFASGALTRGLYRFDLTPLPAGAVIQSATLRLSVIFVPPSGPSATFNLHRLLKHWIEGEGIGNQGQPATDGGASWLNRTTEPWTQPGGAPGQDFVAAPSATLTIESEGSYEFTSAQLTQDVQAFATNPLSNFGWMLKADNETILQTAKRFGSKESSLGQPELIIQYSLAPARPQITSIRREGTNLRIDWSGGTPNFQLERTEALTPANWQPVTALQAERSATVPQPPTTGFFRVASSHP